MIAPWPFAGRTTHLEELGRHYRDPDCAGVVLHGPAGVGKTRLADEALRLAERGGRPVQRIIGHPTTQEIPLGALAHLLPAELTIGLGVGEEERTALFHGARAELHRLAGDGRLVMLVDDLDLLDDTSVAVLVPMIMGRSVFLVGTVRTGRSPSDRLAALHRDGHLARMEVGPLEPDEVGTLLHRALDGPVSDTARAELARLSGGNLQVLIELVRGACERGVLRSTDGAWELTGPLPTTAALEDLVADHLAGIDADGIAALELLAVAERIGLAEVVQRCGASTMETLEASGLVAVVTAGDRTAVRLAHPLYGEVLRGRLPHLRLRRVQGELADMIESRGARRREDVLLVALWRVASGGEISGDRLLHAARLALAGHDAALALRLMNARESDDLDAADRAEVLVEALAMLGAQQEVEELVASVWDADLADARRAHLAKRLADVRFYRGRDLPGALDAHARARSRLTDADVIVAVDARRASLLAGAGRPRDALAITEAMGEVRSVRARVEMSGARAVALINLGRFDEARTVAQQAALDHSQLPSTFDRRGIAQHLLNEAHALAYSGRYREARELLEPAAARARATSAIGAWVWFEMSLAEVARDTGRGHEAIRRFGEVARVAPNAGQHAALVWAHVGVAQGHLLLGQCHEAAAALADADRAGESPVATSLATRERTRAWLDACHGDLASARKRIRATVVPVRRDEIHVMEVALLHDLVRLGVPDEAIERLATLAQVVDGPLVTHALAHARGLAEHDVEVLSAAVDGFESIDALASAAEAAAELADLHRGRAEARLASAASRRSAELAERAGGVRTFVLTRGAGVEPLTAREREVALLAANGHSSREIGTHLGLSTRTVDTHLTRVYRKLGIVGRSELTAALDG